ncbi:hypothetical protein Tco_0538119 [Tanacetum coccineum]
MHSFLSLLNCCWHVSALGILTSTIVNGTHQNAIRKDYLSRFGILKMVSILILVIASNDFRFWFISDNKELSGKRVLVADWRLPVANLGAIDYGIRIDTSTDGKNNEVGLGRMERVLQLQRKDLSATKSVTTDTPASATPMPSEINLQTTEKTEPVQKTTWKGKWLKMHEISTSPTEPSSAETSPQLPASLNAVLPQPVSPESTEKHELKTAGTPSETTKNPLKRTLFPDTPADPKKKKKD